MTEGERGIKYFNSRNSSRRILLQSYANSHKINVQPLSRVCQLPPGGSLLLNRSFAWENIVSVYCSSRTVEDALHSPRCKTNAADVPHPRAVILSGESVSSKQCFSAVVINFDDNIVKWITSRTKSKPEPEERRRRATLQSRISREDMRHT